MSDLQKKIHEAIDGLRETFLDSGNSQFVELVKDAIDALPCFAPVEPKELPDSVGVWHREGVSVLIMKSCCAPHELWCWYHGADGGATSMRVTSMVKGGWVQPTLLVPPAKPAEPRMTQEAWAVVSVDSQSINHTWSTEDLARRWVQSRTRPSEFMVVRIPPLPMETEQ